MNHRILTDPEAWRAHCRKNMPVAEDAPIGIFSPQIKDIEATPHRDVVFTANTADIDLDNEVVVPAGADLSHIQQNGQAFADHCYDVASAVGAIRKTWMVAGQWRQRVAIYNKPGNKALCDDIHYMARLGKIGASIGFVAIDFGPPSREEAKAYSRDGKTPSSIVRTWLWLETSFTAMPCNVACQSLGAGLAIDERTIGELDQLVTKGRIRRASAVALGLPDSPVRRYHSTSPPTRRIVVVT